MRGARRSVDSAGAGAVKSEPAPAGAQGLNPMDVDVPTPGSRPVQALQTAVALPAPVHARPEPPSLRRACGMQIHIVHQPCADCARIAWQRERARRGETASRTLIQPPLMSNLWLLAGSDLCVGAARAFREELGWKRVASGVWLVLWGCVLVHRCSAPRSWR